MPEYRVIELTKFEQVKRYWNKFREALDKLNSLAPDTEKVSQETFLRATLDAIDQGGVVPVFMRPGEGDILCLAIVMNSSNRYHKPSLLIYAAHSWGDATVVAFALKWLEVWAKERGFEELQAWSPRINGSAFYLFEKKWGFRRRSIYFTKAI